MRTSELLSDLLSVSAIMTHLTQAGMANLTTLTAKNAQISNLTGLEHATNLTRLDLRNNSISSITALSGLTELTKLLLAFNSITDAGPLSNLTELTFLSIRDNQIGSVTALGNLTKLKTLWIKNCGITDVSPLVTLSELETLRIAGNALTNAHLLGNLEDLNSVDIDIPDPPDTTAPGVSISVPSGTQTGAFDVTITFTKTVSGFVGSDVSLSGSAASITSWSANSDNTVYTATITPTASGTVTIGVAANVATDAANNQNTAATSKNVTVSVDTRAPGVTVSVPSGTQNGAFNATITFSETVSGFAQSDVSLTGSAASITSWSANSDDTVYTATITPTASGTVTVSVAASVATDAANNPNTAATSQTVTITLPETTPDPATWMPDANLRAAVRSALGIASNANFSKADLSTLTSLRAVQVQVTNLTGLEYATGLTTLVAWGNRISSLTPIQNLTSLTDLRIGNNQISDVTPLDDLTSLTKLGMQHNNISDVTPLAGLVNLTWLRLAGNPISDLSPLVTLVKVTDSDVDLPEPDTTAPGVSISVPSGTQAGAFDATMTFSATVSGFVQADLTLSGTAAASITAWSTTDDITYTAEITPTLSGNVTLSIPAGVATDAANNPNTAATPQTVNVDVGSPSVSITVPEEVQSGSFNVTILFNKPVSGFQGPPDISFAGSTATATINTVWISNPWNDVEHTVSITPTTSGQLTISVPAGVATDTAGNPNTASTPQTVTVDVDKPTVSIGVPSGMQTGAFDTTITFSETVSGFAQSDVSLSGSAASITSWSANSDDTVYTATITPTASGTVTVSVAANVATDAANNQNAAATSKTVTASVDTESPGVSIAVPSGVQNGVFNITITFTETVSGFEGSEVSLTGSSASITSWSANSANTVYTATITPTASGAVTIGVAANVATDAANNQNTAATSKTVTTLVVQPEQVDTTSPSVTLTLSASEQEGNNNRIEIQITFTEPVEGFEHTDLSVTTNGLTALESNVSGGEIPLPVVSITGWTSDPDKTTYTTYIRTYTKTEGQVIVSVDADVATDVAGNPNIAGEALTVDVNGPFLYVFADPVGPGGSAPATNCQVISPVDFYPGHPGRLDVNQDDNIDEDDVAMVEAALGQFGDGIVNSRTDINCDDTVDEDDLALLNDTESPSVSIIVPTDAQPGAFKIKISFSEIVFDFDVTDISLAGSTATATSRSGGYGWTESAITYDVEITPTTSGNVVINVPAAVVTDALGNENTAATQETVTVNTGMPSVRITTSSGSVGENGVFDILITFSEAVSGFVQEDLRLYGSANPSITAWTTTDDTVFTATITPASHGWVRCYVRANVATDADNNPNSASGMYDRDANPPTVTVFVPTGEQPGAFDITFSFSEIVRDFEQTDVSLAGSTADAEITDWTVVSHYIIQYGTRYEATITPTTSGTVVISVPAGVAIDLSRNGNTASASHSITVSLPGSSLAPASLNGIVLDPTVLNTLDPEMLEAHLDILRAGSDGSLKYLQAIALLESVLAEVRPEKTVLLANYPNPFNPETWIPYHLANASDVQISIYDISGALVRQLDLGHQRAGHYTSRSRSAYWDGRNGSGEFVASGVYFYTLTADTFRATRKMLIGK